MERGSADAHLVDAALNPTLLEGDGASELSHTLLQERERGEAGGDHAAAAASAAARPIAVSPLADVDIARRVVAWWRALVAKRKGVLLLSLLALPDLFQQEVLRRLGPTDLASLAGAGRGCAAAVAATALMRWAKYAKNNPSYPCSRFGLKAAVSWAARGGYLEVLKWMRSSGCPWDTMICPYAAYGGQLDVLQWAREHHCPWDAGTCSTAAMGGHLELLQWARANRCPWYKTECEMYSRNHPETLAWVRQQPE
jgi:hypothetical protein